MAGNLQIAANTQRRPVAATVATTTLLLTLSFLTTVQGATNLRGALPHRKDGRTLKAIQWYPHQDSDGNRYCANDASYPDEWLDSGHFLFDTESECCDFCIVADSTCCTPPATVPAVKEAKWYPHQDSAGQRYCANDALYSDSFVTSTAQFLFDSEGECCTAFQLECGLSVEEYWYPIEIDNGLGDGGVVNDCVFDADYPPAYLAEGLKELVLFDTEVACCDAYGCTAEGGDSAASTTPTEYYYPKTVDNEPSCVLGADYPPEYKDSPSPMLFETLGGCCNQYPIVQGECTELRLKELGVTSPPPTTTAAATTVEATDATTTVAATTAAEVTEAAIDATTVPEGTTSEAPTTLGTRPATTEATTLDPCTDCIWHEDPNTPNTCTNSGDVPQMFLDAREHFFHQTAEACCAAKFPNGECTIVDVNNIDDTASATTTIGTRPATTTTEATTMDLCEDCIWHEDHTTTDTCTNSPDYPDLFEQARPYFFYHTAEDCCTKHFGDAPSCTIVDVTATTTVATQAASKEDGYFTPASEYMVDSFETAERSLPFDFGSTAMWELTTEEHHSGSHSLVNVPVDVLGAISSAQLKMHLTEGSTISCMAKIQTSMPYEYFALFVNGQQRNTYAQVIGGWIPVITGLGPGDNTIQFSVVNNSQEHYMGEERTSHFGTGRVYLDDCEIKANRLY
jgi:hypothetical protein